MGPILVADDHADSTELLRIILTGAGYDVVVANDASSAAELAAEHHPALALLDLAMPRQDDGIALARRLKSDPRTSGIVLVALTGSVEDRGRREAERAGFDGFITKPIDTRAFPDVVASYLATAPGGRG